MKKTTKKDIIKKAKELHQIIENRKAIEKAERSLKEFFKTEFPEGVIAGEYLVSTKECTRTNLDKKQLILEFGEDTINEFITETHYLQIDVKEVG